MAPAFLLRLQAELLAEARVFDHPADYRAGVEDTVAAYRDAQRQATEERELSPAHAWFG